MKVKRIDSSTHILKCETCNDKKEVPLTTTRRFCSNCLLNGNYAKFMSNPHKHYKESK